MMTLQKANINDLTDLHRIYVRAIDGICKNHYDQDQLNAWKSSIENQKRWINAINEQYFIVAKIKNKIVGFGSLENGNYVDFLYVDKDYLKKGIARGIYENLEREAIRRNEKEINADVSKTARPFFEKNGFKIVKTNTIVIGKVQLTNYSMLKIF